MKIFFLCPSPCFLRFVLWNWWADSPTDRINMYTLMPVGVWLAHIQYMQRAVWYQLTEVFLLMVESSLDPTHTSNPAIPLRYWCLASIMPGSWPSVTGNFWFSIFTNSVTRLVMSNAVRVQHIGLLTHVRWLSYKVGENLIKDMLVHPCTFFSSSSSLSLSWVRLEHKESKTD